MPDPQSAATPAPTPTPPDLNLENIRWRTLQQARAELPQPQTPEERAASFANWTEQQQEQWAKEHPILPPTSRLGQAYAHLKSIVSKHEGQISERYLKPVREHLDKMAQDLVAAGESGHTRTGGQLTTPARLLTLGVGNLLKMVPVGEDVQSTLAANVVPPEFGPEGKALSRELKAGEKVAETAAPRLEGVRTRETVESKVVSPAKETPKPSQDEPAPNLTGVRARPVTDRVSTRLPSSPKSTENPLQREPLIVGRDVVRNSPGLAERLADQVRDYDGLKVPKNVKDPEKVLDHFQKHLEANIEWAHNQAASENPAKVAQNRKWYESANRIAGDLSAKHGMEKRQGAGIIASQSPQKDWDMNVSLAERLADIYDTKNDIKFTPEMSAKAKQLAAKSDEIKKIVISGALEGKTLGELTKPYEKAAWIRTYDETYHPRSFHKIDPGTGERVGLRITKKGEPADVAWGSLNEIAKAVRIMEDGSRENISANLGDFHKVRNFYNNIADPTHAHDVTIDTHAVAVAHMMPFGGKAPEVKAHFDGPASNFTGSTGTYPIYAEAYRNVAKKLGLLPRELQSIDWEWGRDLFDSMKTPEGLKFAKKQWKLYDSGKQTANQTRTNIMREARRLKAGE